MEKNTCKIIFYGTPDFAVASLKAMVETGFNIVAVVTMPDKASGRGKQLLPSAVKQYALTQNLPVLQPENLKNPDFVKEIEDLKADLQIVVAFRMMPEIVWNMPPMGTINLHGSLLPQYRGAAPINRAIMNGETETGVTTFKLKHQIDTGDILLSRKIPILLEDNVGTIYEKLMDIGAKLLIETIDGLLDNTIKEIPQDNIDVCLLKSAPKIFKEDCLIDWNKDSVTILNQVRGLSPYPAAYTYLNDKSVKVFKVSIEKEDSVIGEFVTDGKNYLKFGCKDGSVFIEELQIEGKNRVDIKSFLRGFRDKKKAAI